MSTVTYRYENNLQQKVGGVKETLKQNIIDGEKGLSFVFLIKKGEKSFYKVSGKETDKDKFQVSEKVDEKITEHEFSKTELMKFLKGNKNLTFVEHYISKERAKFHKGGAKKGSRKAKKGSKKGAKKASKKGSKKRSKKTSKKGSKKGSKKRSKKRSKKQSGGAKRRGSKKSKKGSKKSKKGSKKSKKGSKKAKKGSKKSKKGSKKTKKRSKKSKKISA